MVILALMLVAGAPEPSPEALRLGRELAGRGTLASLLPLMQAKETEELISGHPELTPAEQAQLREVAKRVFTTGQERLLSATGRAYAERLSVKDLKALVAFHRTPAARRHQASMPGVIAQSMQSVGKLDFKGDVIAAYCKQTGKLCAP